MARTRKKLKHRRMTKDELTDSIAKYITGTAILHRLYCTESILFEYDETQEVVSDALKEAVIDILKVIQKVWHYSLTQAVVLFEGLATSLVAIRFDGKQDDEAMRAVRTIARTIVNDDEFTDLREYLKRDAHPVLKKIKIK